MVVQMLFSERYVFERYGMSAALKLNKFVYPNPTHFPPGPHFTMFCKMGAPTNIKVSGRLTLSHPAANTFKKLILLSSIQLAFNVIYNRIDGEQVG